jgi:hypothetical protein
MATASPLRLVHYKVEKLPTPELRRLSVYPRPPAEWRSGDQLSKPVVRGVDDLEA